MREGWTYKKLGEVCETSSGGTPSKSHLEYYEGGTIPWLRSGEVAQGLIYNAELCITDLGLAKSSAKIFPIDTVVIAMYGATVGQVGLLKKEMATNQAICGIFPNRYLHPLFLLYSLKSKKSLFLNDAVGGAQPNISQNLIKNTILPIPPLSEQERIVSELDLLSSIIEKKKEQLKAYDQLAQSIFYEMFGDPIENPKGWEVKKLGEIGTIITGSTLSTKEADNYNSDDYCFIKPSDIMKESITPLYDSEYHISEKAYSNSRKLPKGSVLITCIGIVGKVGVLNVNATCNQQINAVVPKTSVLSTFLAFSLFLQRSFIETKANAPVVPIINKKEFSLFTIPVPPLSLQQSFASKIESIEHQKSLIQQSIKEVQTLFDSRMDYYFN